MKKLLIIGCALIGTCCADDNVLFEKSYDYTTVGGLVPSVGIGHREKLDDCNALDSSVNLSSIVIVSSLTAEIKYLHYYPKNHYVGVGLTAGVVANIAGDASAVVAPVITKGWEHEKTFCEINANFPITSKYGTSYIPGLSFRYGFKF